MSYRLQEIDGTLMFHPTDIRNRHIGEKVARVVGGIALVLVVLVLDFYFFNQHVDTFIEFTGTFIANL